MRARLDRREEKLTRLTFRAPASLHEFLTRAAQESNRSVNHEIVSRLEASVELDRKLKMGSSDEVLEELGKLTRRLADLRSREGTKE